MSAAWTSIPPKIPSTRRTQPSIHQNSSGVSPLPEAAAADGSSLATVPNHHHPRSSSPRQQQQQQQLEVTIVSARYQPCEGAGRRAGGPQDAAHNNDNDTTVAAAFSRDVTPFVRALLLVQKNREQEENGDDNNNHDQPQVDSQNKKRMQQQYSSESYTTTTTAFSNSVRLNAVVHGQQRAQIRILDENSLGMNGIFGDPVPGTSKRLHIHYIVAELDDDDDDEGSNNNNPVNDDGAGGRDAAISPSKRRRQRLAKGQSHTLSFAEHERVHLRRRMFALNDYQQDADSSNVLSDGAVKEGTPQSVDYDDSKEPALPKLPGAASTNNNNNSGNNSSSSSSSPSSSWHLDRATSEIVLPLVMPFLGILDRVQCRTVSRAWTRTIASIGVAVTIDDQDPSLAPLFLNNLQQRRSFLRGMLRHSHRSLRSLFLSGTPGILKADLHPAIPHLQQLRSLDISRCVDLDNSTLQLLAQHVPATLQVLYMKGLRRVTDDGVLALTRTCRNLNVLDLSYLPALTDAAGLQIGQRLTALRALYLRDNFRLTNASVDAITSSCTRLEQLTVWGCTRLTRLSFPGGDGSNNKNTSNLVLLNLWGCFGLRDEMAQTLRGMDQLKSLIVSECHRLTDDFVISIASYLPQLKHLHLRYCFRLTDEGVNAIASSMPDLYSLDLSFCTKVTMSALFGLLELRGRSLAELRLQGCNQLEVALDPNAPDTAHHHARRHASSEQGGYAGRQLLCVLRSHGSHCALSILDVRQCKGQPSLDRGYPNSDLFVQGMAALHFEQKAPGLFSRAARCSSELVERLVRQFTTI